MMIIGKQFNGGVNLEDFPGDLLDNEVRRAINAVLTKKGSLKKREGSSEYGTDADIALIYAIKGYSDSSGNYYRFKQKDTAVVEYHAGAWDTDIKTGLTTGLYLKMSNIKVPVVASVKTGTASAGAEYSLTDSGIAWTVNAYRDYVVKITAGTGIGQVKTILENTAEILYVDGRWDINPDATSEYSIHLKVEGVISNNGTDSAFKIIGSTATDLSAVPKFTDQVVHNSRLWGILGSKIYWSGLANGEQWDDYAYIDTGEELTGIGRTKNFIAIYSKNKNGVILGDNPDNLSLRWRENTHGCFSKLSIASWNGYSIAMAQSGIYAFDGNRDYLISRKITPAINDMNVGLKDEAFGLVFNDKYYLLHAQDSSSTVKDTMFVMDLIWSRISESYGVWTTFEGINCNVIGVYKDSDGLNQLYIGKSDSSKVVLLFDDTYNDETSSIKFDIVSKEYDKGAVSVFGKLGWFFYEGATQSTVSDLQVYKNLDGKGFELFGTVEHIQTGGLWDVAIFDVATFGGSERKIQRYRPGGRGRTIQYQLYNNMADQAIEMFKFEQQVDLYNLH